MSRFAVVPSYWLRHPSLSVAEKATLAVLATFADETGYCWPSVSVLATCLATSDRTVQRSLQVLVEAGAVKVKRRFNEDGRATSNGYWVRGYDQKVPQVSISAATGEPFVRGAGDTHVTGDGDTHVTGMVTPMSPKQYQLKQDQKETATTPPAAPARIAFSNPEMHLAYQEYRYASRNGKAFDASLHAILTGMTTGKPVPELVLGLALMEMAANGEAFNVSRLRGYVRKHETQANRPADSASLLDPITAAAHAKYPHLSPAGARAVVELEAELAAKEGVSA